MSSMPSITYAVGALVSITMGWVTTYHVIAYANVGFAVGNALVMYVLPESPVYLALVGRDEVNTQYKHLWYLSSRLNSQRGRAEQTLHLSLQVKVFCNLGLKD